MDQAELLAEQAQLFLQQAQLPLLAAGGAVQATLQFLGKGRARHLGPDLVLGPVVGAQALQHLQLDGIAGVVDQLLEVLLEAAFLMRNTCLDHGDALAHLLEQLLHPLRIGGRRTRIWNRRQQASLELAEPPSQHGQAGAHALLQDLLTAGAVQITAHAQGQIDITREPRRRLRCRQQGPAAEQASRLAADGLPQRRRRAQRFRQTRQLLTGQEQGLRQLLGKFVGLLTLQLKQGPGIKKGLAALGLRRLGAGPPELGKRRLLLQRRLQRTQGRMGTQGRILQACRQGRHQLVLAQGDEIHRPRPARPGRG